MFLGPAYLPHYIINAPPSASDNNGCSAIPFIVVSHCIVLVRLVEQLPTFSNCGIWSVPATMSLNICSRRASSRLLPLAGSSRTRLSHANHPAGLLPILCRGVSSAHSDGHPKVLSPSFFFFWEWPCYRQLLLFLSRTLCLCSWSHI